MARLGNVQMQRVRSALPVVIALLLVGNAVALAAYEAPGGGDGRAGGSPVAVKSTPSPDSTLPPVTVAPTASTKPVAKAKKGSSPTTTTSSTLPLFPEVTEGEFAYDVTIEPRCVKPGQELTATFRLKPNAWVVALPVYSSGPDKEQYYTGKTTSESVLVYKWNALPKLGHGLLTTQAIDKDTDKKGSVSRRFHVSAGGTC